MLFSRLNSLKSVGSNMHMTLPLSTFSKSERLNESIVSAGPPPSLPGSLFLSLEPPPPPPPPPPTAATAAAPRKSRKPPALLRMATLRVYSSRRSSSVFMVRNLSTSRLIDEATTVRPNRMNVNESMTYVVFVRLFLSCCYSLYKSQKKFFFIFYLFFQFSSNSFIFYL